MKGIDYWVHRILYQVSGAAMFFYAAAVEWTLWYWFAVPLGAPEVKYLHFAGLSLAIGLLTNSQFVSSGTMVLLRRSDSTATVDKKYQPMTPRQDRELDALAHEFVALTLAWIVGFILSYGV